MGTGDFFGEGCLTGQPQLTVSAITECVFRRDTAQPAFDLPRRQQAAHMIGELSFWVCEFLED
jgi:hypothetical protein